MKYKAVILPLIAALLLAGCASTESTSAPVISQTELIGEIYHGDEYFILDKTDTFADKDGCAYDSEKKVWNAPFAVGRKINDTFYADDLKSPDEFGSDGHYKGELPKSEDEKLVTLSVGDITSGGLTVTSAHSSIKEMLEYDRENGTSKPAVSEILSSDMTLSGEAELEGVIYVVLGEDMYIAEENTVLFFPYPESLEKALGFSPNITGDITETFLTSNTSKTNVCLCGDCVYFYVGNTDSCDWLTKDFDTKPFGIAKLTVSDLKLSWQDDRMDLFSADVIKAENVQAIR